MKSNKDYTTMNTEGLVGREFKLNSNNMNDNRIVSMPLSSNLTL